MTTLPAVITPPARLPKQPLVTEAQLAHLLRVTPETLRAWRRRGEMPPVAVGPERDEFCRGLKVHGRWPVCYRVLDVSAWLWGNSGPGGRPKELPASAFDPANDRTTQLRRAGQAAKSAGDTVAEKRIRRQLTTQAKFAARLGFASPTAYEDWIARGAPEDELPPECRPSREVPLVDDESSERLQLRSDAAIAKMRRVLPAVVTAERHRAERQRAEVAPPLQPLDTPKVVAREQPRRHVPEPDPYAVLSSARSKFIDEWNRRAAELEPIEGF
jgi:hypothetical protein